MHTFRHGSKIPMGFFQQFRHEHGLAAARGTDHQNVGWGAKHDCDTRVWRSFLYVEKTHTHRSNNMFFIVTSPCLTIERGHDSLDETV